jgi:hypothetical protein
MNGVIYFNDGNTHLVRMLVSIYSLRKFWSGPIAVLDSTSRHNRSTAKTVDAICSALDCEKIRIVSAGKPYVTKAMLWRSTPFSKTLFLDSDTIVADNLSPIFGFGSLVVTRFSNWSTETPLIVKRLRQWSAVECNGMEVKQLLHRSLGDPHVAINTGVVAWYHGHPILPEWERLTAAGDAAGCILADELAMQLLVRKHHHVIAADRWNLSCRYGVETHCPKVIHLHGGKHIGRWAHPLWKKEYDECVRRNIARVKRWQPAGDTALARLL